MTENHNLRFFIYFFKKSPSTNWHFIRCISDPLLAWYFRDRSSAIYLRFSIKGKAVELFSINVLKPFEKKKCVSSKMWFYTAADKEEIYKPEIHKLVGREAFHHRNLKNVLLVPATTGQFADKMQMNGRRKGGISFQSSPRHTFLF